MRHSVLLMLLALASQASDSRVEFAMNAFTTDTYKQVMGDKGNLILSPFNIATALSMILPGARGKTAHEIQSVLHVHYDSSYDQELAAVTKSGAGDGNELNTANAVWLQKGFVIQPAFETTLNTNYLAPLTTLDFGTNPETARAQINHWTEEKTKGKIKDLLPGGSLDSRTRMVLTSAIYFYGNWARPFIPSATESAPFHGPDSAHTKTDFMNQTSHFGYGETPSAQILEMRYVGDGIAFDVLLPKSGNSLSDLEKELTPKNLTGWIGSITNQNVRVSLPKFRATSEFSLQKTLSAMGMPTAFTDQADFSGITAHESLSISQVVHKAFVDVSEQGTEAAAATGIAIHATAMRLPEKAIVFHADHPFLFLIRDTRSGAVLFIGRLTNPR